MKFFPLNLLIYGRYWYCILLKKPFKRYYSTNYRVMIRTMSILVFLMLPIWGYCQHGKGFIAHSQFNAGTTLNKSDQKYDPINYQLAAGYSFNRTLSLSFISDLAVDVMRIDDTDFNYFNVTAGLSLGINITQPGDSCAWEVYCSAASTLSTTRYGYLYGDIGIRTIKVFRDGWSPFLFVSLKYQHSYSSRFDNFLITNVGLGFKFGYPK